MSDDAEHDAASGGRARIIRLRRPPILSHVEGPFVPDAPAAALADVDARWAELCRANPAFHDGRMCHVLGVHRNGHGGAVVHVTDCAFRYHAVQTSRFDLGIRPLGVKGVTVRDDRALLGRRAASVAAYAGLWEFAPGGVVEPGERPDDTVVRELREEAGLGVTGEPVAQAMLFDPEQRTWEIVYRLSAGAEVGPRTEEYTALQWCSHGDWPQPLSPVARTIADEVVVAPHGG